MKKNKTVPQPPTIPQLEAELKREQHRRRYRRALRSTIYTLITVAAVAVLVATLWMPVLQIYGSSMSPTLEGGQIVLSVKSGDFAQGDVIAFYYNNKILIKRVIAVAGDWVNITEDGNVYVNDVLLDEPYLTEKALGTAISSCPIRCRNPGCSSWGTIGAFLWTPETRRWAVSRKNRLLESCGSASGRWIPSAKWSNCGEADCQRFLPALNVRRRVQNET